MRPQVARKVMCDVRPPILSDVSESLRRGAFDGRPRDGAVAVGGDLSAGSWCQLQMTVEDLVVTQATVQSDDDNGGWQVVVVVELSYYNARVEAAPESNSEGSAGARRRLVQVETRSSLAQLQSSLASTGSPGGVTSAFQGVTEVDGAKAIQAAIEATIDGMKESKRQMSTVLTTQVRRQPGPCSLTQDDGRLASVASCRGARGGGR